MKATSRAVVSFLFLALLTLPAKPGTRADEQPDFDALASHVAAAIRDSTKGLSQGAAVLILNFEEERGRASELAPELASEFHAALREHSQGFVVLDAADLNGAISNHHLPETTLSSTPAMICYAPDLGATVYIEGRLERGPDEVQVEVTAIQVSPRKSIFGDKAKYQMTASMLRLAAKPAPPPPPIFTKEEKVWINPDQSLPNTKAPSQLTKAALPNSLPECEYCPQPLFSDAAIFAKFTGTVTLRVQIRVDGIPAKISIVEGLPCGLTDNAVAEVKHWRFKPATGPNGEPVAVEQTVEVTFQMY
jgi:TonB family protein